MRFVIFPGRTMQKNLNEGMIEKYKIVKTDFLIFSETNPLKHY